MTLLTTNAQTNRPASPIGQTLKRLVRRLSTIRRQGAAGPMQRPEARLAAAARREDARRAVDRLLL